MEETRPNLRVFAINLMSRTNNSIECKDGSVRKHISFEAMIASKLSSFSCMQFRSMFYLSMKYIQVSVCVNGVLKIPLISIWYISMIIVLLFYDPAFPTHQLYLIQNNLQIC